LVHIVRQSYINERIHCIIANFKNNFLNIYSVLCQSRFEIYMILITENSAKKASLLVLCLLLAACQTFGSRGTSIRSSNTAPVVVSQLPGYESTIVQPQVTQVQPANQSLFDQTHNQTESIAEDTSQIAVNEAEQFV